MSWNLRRSTAVFACRAIQAVLPPTLQSWGHAIRIETDAIADDTSALLFALESVFGLIPRALAWQILRPFSGLIGAEAPFTGRPVLATLAMAMLQRPRIVGISCAIGSVALGLVYLTMAGAPARNLGVNAGALLLSLVFLAMLSRIAFSHQRAIGVSLVAMAVTLLATGLLGVSAEGAARWVRVSGFSLQPSLIFVPIMLVAFARRRSALAAAGIIAGAIAMAIQPDRAMAGVMVAGLAALAFCRADRLVAVALGVSIICFGATLLRSDTLPAVQFVDQVLTTSFGIHPLAGVSVLTGLALLIIPATLGWRADLEHRDIYVTFGAVWLAIIIAAGLGNYPTPIVGYGASAIIGYVLSLLALPKLVAAHVGIRSQSDGTTARGSFDGHLLAGGA